MLLILVILFVAVPLAIAIQAAILQWSVSLTNSMLGGKVPTDNDYEFVGSSWTPKLKTQAGYRIPPPNGAHAAAMVVIAGAINTLFLFIVVTLVNGVQHLSFGTDGIQRMFLRTDQMIWISLIPVCILIRLSLISGMLPTTIGKATVVIITEFIVGLLFSALVAGMLLIVGLAALPK